MPDFAPDAFNIWANFNKDQKKDGHYWAMMDVPVAELRKLVEWVKTADRCENLKGLRGVRQAARQPHSSRCKRKRQRISADGSQRCQAPRS